MGSAQDVNVIEGRLAIGQGVQHHLVHGHYQTVSASGKRKERAGHWLQHSQVKTSPPGILTLWHAAQGHAMYWWWWFTFQRERERENH